MGALWPSFGHQGKQRAAIPLPGVYGAVSEEGDHAQDFQPLQSMVEWLAESAMKNCKKLLIKCIDGGEEFGPALPEFRNCPRGGRLLPSAAHVCRRMTTTLPATVDAFDPIPLSYTEVARKKTHNEALSWLGSHHLEVFQEGDEVWVLNRRTGA